MKAEFIFQTMQRHRRNLVKILENTPEPDLADIPEGFRNNIWWNISHILVVQQLLCYKLSGLPLNIPNDWVGMYSKGTFPGELPDREQRAVVAELLVDTVGKLEQDYNSGIFKDYTTFQNSAGFTLNSIDDALQFNLYHEGLHLGTVLSLLKIVR